MGREEMAQDQQLTRRGPADLGWGDEHWTLRPPPALEAPSIFTWEQAVRVLRKHRWFLGLVIGAVSLATAAAALSMRDAYRPTARLEIDPVGSGITTLHEIESVRGEGDQEYLETQIQILQSDGLAMRVIRALHLDQDREFAAGQQNGGKTKSLSAAETPATTTKAEGFLGDQLELATTTTAEAAALQAFHQKLSVNPVRGSRLVEVSFSSRDAKRAQGVTNALVTQFIDQN